MLKYEDIRARRMKRLEQGFSLRESLKKQGCSEEGIRLHMDFITKTLIANPNLDIERYKVNPDNPNGLPLMG